MTSNIAGRKELNVLDFLHDNNFQGKKHVRLPLLVECCKGCLVYPDMSRLPEMVLGCGGFATLKIIQHGKLSELQGGGGGGDCLFVIYSIDFQIIN